MATYIPKPDRQPDRDEVEILEEVAQERDEINPDDFQEHNVEVDAEFDEEELLRDDPPPRFAPKRRDSSV